MFSLKSFSKSRLGSFSVKIVLTITSALATLIALEIFVRAILPQQLILSPAGILIADQDLAWTHGQNLNFSVNTGERTVRLKTDENGHRIGSGRYSSDEPTYRILAIGDSFVAALQVEYEQTLVARLEKALGHTLGTSIVVNAGTDGWTPVHYLLKARKELRRNEYDLVLIFLYLGNDLINERQLRWNTILHKLQNNLELGVDDVPEELRKEPLLRLPNQLELREFTAAILLPVNNYLARRSHLFLLAKFPAHLTLIDMGLTTRYFLDNLLRSTASSKRWGVTADICALLAEEISTFEIPSLFILLPSVYEVDLERTRRAMDAFDIDPHDVDLDQPARLLRKELETRHLRVLDTTKALRLSAQVNSQDIYGETDKHFGPRGHEIVSELLAPSVVGMLRSSPQEP